MSARYATPERLPREQALTQLESPESVARMDALLSLALYDPDWRLAQDRCLALLDDPDSDVVATAILGLAHVARLHRVLDLERVLPQLDRLRSQPALLGRVEDALDDIAVFIGLPDDTA
jgi:hypothetical protein